MTTALFIFRGWLASFVAWIRQPSDDAVLRARQHNEKRARREATRMLR